MLKRRAKRRRDAATDEFYEGTEVDKEETRSLTRGHDGQLELLEAVDNSKVMSYRAAAHQLLVTEDAKCKLSSKLDQLDCKLLHKKKELWTFQDKKQFSCLEDNVTAFPVSTAPLKDDDEEKPQGLSFVWLSQSQTQGGKEAEDGINSTDEQMQTQMDAEAFGGPETTRGPDPNKDRKTLGSSVSEVTNDSDGFVYEYWQKPLSDSELESEAEDSGLNNSSINTDGKCNTCKKSFVCFLCGKQYHYYLSFNKHVLNCLEKSTSSSD